MFLIVVVGGLTRLTESGLSITEWNLIKGMKPPRTEEEWMVEFEKYKMFPEYKLLNRNITLPEFKFIFYMEWGHRMIGRFIGLTFILPGLYFARMGYMSSSIATRSMLVAIMIGAQGVLGWYMVKSGLREELMEKTSFHGVSQYWLAAHLGSAFFIYSTMLLTGFEILHRSSKNAVKATEVLQTLMQQHRSLVSFRRFSYVVAFMVFVTALSGAFVAGLDAGLVYNEFPYMGEGFVPSDYWGLSEKSVSISDTIPYWRNIFENPSAVQFNHRLLATTTATLILTLFALSRSKRNYHYLPRPSQRAVAALTGIATLQVCLGITTLIYLVPVPLAAAHQSGSLLLLSTALWLVHTLRVFPK